MSNQTRFSNVLGNKNASKAYTPRIWHLFIILIYLVSLLGVPTGSVQAATITFTGKELLGRPEANSISISIIPDTAITLYYQYGTTSGGPYTSTSTVSAAAAASKVVVINGLTANTKYYYRMQYSTDGSTWTVQPEHSFQTQRAAGSSFSFDVTSDSHVNIMLGSASTWTNTLNDIAANHPDFLIDLGDTFAMDSVTNATGADTAYRNQLQYFNIISASSPIFLVSGNHEQTEGWHMTASTGYQLPVLATNSMKKYFLNPVPDSFYSGDTSTLSAISGDHLREDYYSWTWGDALFVVIDPYWFTTTKPYTTDPGGGESDTTGSGNRWDWTLGLDQFNWLKTTLENSTAKYKFIFSHQEVSSDSTSGQVNYGHGGVNAANLVEWGGYNVGGTVWGWDTNRAVAQWGSQTIHQMMVANGVSAFFHGHDHQYGYEKLDGIVYQAVPSAGFSGNGFSIYSTGGNSGKTIQALPSSGHLKVTVGPSQATVDYIQTSTTTSAYSYNIAAAGPTYNLTTAVNPPAGGTISPAAGVHPYAQGSTVDVTATPAAGYIFSSWSGGACDGDAPCSVTMDADKTVTANFTAVPTYTLTTAVSPSGGGTISPAAGDHPYNQDTVVSVTATAASGYGFSSWSGACTGSGPCSVTMDGPKTVTANFVASISFTGTELLGRPEANSISVSVVPATAISLYYEFGTSPGVYTDQTSTVSAAAGQPQVVTISDLTPNTKYYYRMQYSPNGSAPWTARPEKSFVTQREAGSTFTFDITSDSHINIQLGNSSNWTSTLNGVASDNADFLIDLGDTFAMDNGSTTVALGDTAAAEQKYKDTLPSFNIVSGSSPIFLVPGNHEEQEAWHLQGTLANSLPVMGKNAEKKFFLNPVNDSFYSGDTSTYSYLSGDHLKQDYYAWTWGDALFVVISPFWTTTTKPYTTTVGGGETDATGSGNRWDWTLGLDQFNWLKSTLQNSPAKYKFVFAHQIVGGNGLTTPDQVNYGHGGVDSANLVEWGGNNVGTTTSGWATNRPGWGSQPIRQMMEANQVTAFFHGHDHQFAYESLNGMVYQAVPSGSFSGSFGIYSTGGNSGNTIWADSNQGSGHLRVTVGPSQTTVDFIRYNATTPAYTYTMAPAASSTYTLTAGNDGHGTVTLNPAGGTYDSGSTVTLTPVASAGYQFSSWTGANSGDVINTAGVYTIVMNGNKAVTANFTQIQYTLTVSNDGHGTVTLNPTGGTYASGTTVTMTPVPNTNYHFGSWTGANSGNIINTSGVYTIVMNGNKAVTANFTHNNVAPVAVDDVYNTQQNLTMNIPAPGVLSNDTDADGNSLTAINASVPLHGGTLTLNPNGSFSYTPATGYKGDDTFTYQAYDGALSSNTATVTITVNETEPPDKPASFYGEIHILENPPVAGQFVEAYVPGVSTPVASVAIQNTPPLTYTFDVPADLTGTTPVEGGKNGDVITFKINGSVVATSVWHSGTSTELNINVTMQNISLPSGVWSLISFKEHPVSTAIVDVLSSIKGNYGLVYVWDATTSDWLKYDPSAPSYSNTLTSLDETMGFWINMNAGGTLKVSGTPPTTTHIALKTGWNLVGFPSAGSLALPGAFSSHGVTGFTLVYAYHASDTAEPWKKFDPAGPSFANNLITLDTGYGYWVKVGSNCTWDVTY